MRFAVSFTFGSSASSLRDGQENLPQKSHSFLTKARDPIAALKPLNSPIQGRSNIQLKRLLIRQAGAEKNTLTSQQIAAMKADAFKQVLEEEEKKESARILASLSQLT